MTSCATPMDVRPATSEPTPGTKMFKISAATAVPSAGALMCCICPGCGIVASGGFAAGRTDGRPGIVKKTLPSSSTSRPMTSRAAMSSSLSDASLVGMRSACATDVTFSVVVDW
jgi:hypothetical protein